MIQPDRQPTRLALGEIDPVQPIDPTSPLARGLEGLWLPLPHLTGGSRLYDLSGNRVHGDFIGAPTWSFAAQREFPYQAFDGANDAVEILSKDLPLTRYSVFAWIKTSTAGGSGGDGILSRRDRDGSITDFSYNLLVDSNGKINSGHYDGNSFVTPESTTTVSDGLWHYVGVTYNGATVRVFVDGVVEASASASDPYMGDADQRIGLNPYDNNYFQGGIGAVSLHSRGVGGGEGRQLYNQARRGFPSLLNRRDQSALYVSGTSVVTVSEAAALQAQANLAATDTALTRESASLSATASPTATESATATEQAALGSTATLDASETATITEAVGLAASATWSITETVGSVVTEAATLAITTSLSATESATAEESAQVSSSVTFAAQEAATASEALRIETEARLDARESITVTEAARVQVGAALDLIEEASTAEAVKLAATATWSVTETAGKLITGRISEVGRNTVELLSRPFNNAERKDG